MRTISFRKSALFRYISFIVLIAFVGLLPAQPGYGQVAIVMPPIGQMIHVTRHFEPPQMVGLKINLKNPFSFGFIMDQGEGQMSDAVKKEEFNKIVKYFLVSLAMPNKDMWVNLSPYESKRIIPEVFAQTEMGRDLLSQDYVLKQFTSSLMYPEAELGKKFWGKVYQEAQARFGTTDINVNTFNKVWIVADHADVYQKEDTAFLVGSHLKVMLEQDYMAIEQNKEQFGDFNALKNAGSDPKTQMASQIVREIIIPAIEKEVNDGQSFAAVRQIYNAEIMATWFKKTLRASLLGQVFADKSKIAGQKISDPQAKDKIFQQYLLAYKKGVFDYIKREVTSDGQVIPRRYLSGGMEQVENVNDLRPDQTIPPSQAQISTDVQGLSGMLSHALGTDMLEELLRKNIGAAPSLNGNNLNNVIQGIADTAQISPTKRAEIITGMLDQMTPADQRFTDSELAARLSDILSRGQKEGEVQDLLAGPISRINTDAQTDAAMASTLADMPQLKNNPSDAALIAENLKILPAETAAQEIQQFATDKALLAPTRLDLADVSFVNPNQAVEPAAAPTPIELVRTIADAQGMSPEDSTNSMADLVGQMTDATDGERQQLADELSQIKEKEGRMKAAAKHIDKKIPGSSTTPMDREKIARVLNGFAGNRSKVTESVRAHMIGAMLARLANPEASIEELNKSSLELAAQYTSNIPQEANPVVNPPAAQDWIGQQVTTALAERQPQTEKPKTTGGINLSDEHLTMNIKVDGAGMPLPPQYQDKAMLNLNGLVSIIRSITPLTKQNVPALFELVK